MAKVKSTPAERLNALIKETNERQAARSANIAKLEQEKASAEAIKAQADSRYSEAKEALNAAEMIKAKAEVESASEILQMFTEALEKAQHENAFSYDELTSKYSQFAAINSEMNAEANKAICELLAQIEVIADKAEKAAEDLNNVFRSINNNVASCAKLGAGQLVANMQIEIGHTRQNFKEYWPEEK